MSKSPSHSLTPTPRQSTPTPRLTTPTNTTAPPPSTSSIPETTSAPLLRQGSTADYTAGQQQLIPSPPDAIPRLSTRLHHPFPQTSTETSTSAFKTMRRPSSRGPSSSPEYLMQQRESLTNKRRRDHSPGGHRDVRPRASSGSSQSHTGSIADTEEHHDGNSTGTSTKPSVKKKRTRTLTTPYQSQMLHSLLAQSRFPTTAQREEVGRAIGLSSRKVQIWFQNQRQKARRPPRITTSQIPGASQPPTQPPPIPQSGPSSYPSSNIELHQPSFYLPPPPPGSYSASFWERDAYSRQSYVTQAPPQPQPFPRSRTDMPPPQSPLSGPGMHARGGDRGDFQSPYPYEEDRHSPRRGPSSSSMQRYTSLPTPRARPYYRDPGRTLPPIAFRSQPDSMPISEGYYPQDAERGRHFSQSPPYPQRYTSPPPPAHRTYSPFHSTPISRRDIQADTEPAISRGQRYDPVRGVYVPIRRYDGTPPSGPAQ